MSFTLLSQHKIASIAALACLFAALNAHADSASVSHSMTPGNATSKAPSPITPVNAIITNFTGYTGPFPYFMDSFCVSQAGTYSVNLSSPALSNGVYVLRGDFSPSTGTPSTPLSNFVMFSQQLTNTTISPTLEPGRYTALQIFSSGTSAVTLRVTGPGTVAFGTDTCGYIPSFSSMPYVQAVATPTTLDMGSGKGPELNTCLATALPSLLGGNVSLQGQARSGQSAFSLNGRKISYYPVDAAQASSPTPKLSLSGGNRLSVVTSCGTLTVAPALFDVDQFGAAFTAQQIRATINQDGVITWRMEGVTYVARPDYAVDTGSSAQPGLSKGSDGLFRFTGAGGVSQLLRPAFFDTTALAAAAGGSIEVQIDGTAIQSVGGQRWLLVPDNTLKDVPGEHVIDLNAWQDGANHYSYRVLNARPFPEDLFQFTYSQGYTRTLLP